MHAHLRERLEDYGPSHAFWLFSFERYNGLLEDLPNNNRSVEIQLMKRFIENTNPIQSYYREEFSPVFKEKQIVGTLSEGDQTFCELSDSKWFFDKQRRMLPKFSKRGVFPDIQL